MQTSINKIVKNSLFLYIRMLFLMLIGLYTSRVILDTLGVVNLGIYNVVGSIIVLLDFISSGLTNSSQRYLNIGLGKNDLVLTKKYFSQSVGLHFVLSLVVVVLLETVGLWFVKHKLNIPISRQEPALWIYQFAICISFLKINQICLQSVIVARENMSVYSYISMFEGIAKLAVVFLLNVVLSVDALILYVFLLLLIQIILFVVYVLYCYSKFPESHYSFMWDNKLCREMSSFLGINFFGYMAWAGGIQGINIMLNIYFGPALNAAKGLADTFERLFDQVVNSVFMAVRPRIIQSYARDEIEVSIELAEKSSIYIFYMVLIVSIPLLMEMNFVLSIWLKEVPKYTEIFSKLIILKIYFWMLPIPYNAIAIASGKIKNIQLYGRLISLLALPLSYVALTFFKIPYLPTCIVVLMDGFFWLYSINDINKQIESNFYRYIKKVVLPILKVSLCLVIIMFAIHYSLESGFLRVVLEFVSCSIFGIIIVGFVGMPNEDFLYVKQLVLKKINR
jgi:O-antigen/teichoic acid export membrane protein